MRKEIHALKNAHFFCLDKGVHHSRAIFGGVESSDAQLMP